jgi:hypothetical protein
VKKLVLVAVALILGFAVVPCQAQEVTVGDVGGLIAAIDAANNGGPATILLEDGTYSLSGGFNISRDGITIRSVSGIRENVIIEGEGMWGGVPNIFWVTASYFTLQSVSIGNVANHAIQVHGEMGAGHVTVSNVRIFDCYEQMIKVSIVFDDVSVYSDTGLIENCLFEYTAGIGPNWYIGGIDIHGGRHYVIRNNTFQNIISPVQEVGEHAIHIWTEAQYPNIQFNRIINCDRGIGLGMRTDRGGGGVIGATVRNNFIYHSGVGPFADTGIILEAAVNTNIYNNTIYMEGSYPNAIEYRWPETMGGMVVNNLTNRNITARDGASATVSNNVTTAQAGWFVNPAAGDLHLATPVASVVDQGMFIDDFVFDIDGDPRPSGAGIDIGADEWVQ